jgi:hypothetical protein
MAFVSQDVRLAPTGTVKYAPEGTALPTDINDALNASFKDVGYITEDGVSLTPSEDWNDIRAWQSVVPVKKALQEATFELQFAMEQVNVPTTELFFNSTWTSVAGGGSRLDLKSNPPQSIKALILDWEDDETDLYRLVIPRAQLTDREAVQLQRSEATVYGVTVSALEYTGGIFAYLLTDNPDLYPGS